jgi:predicted transcriptional regulator
VTTLARKVGLSRSQVFRLLKGVCEPTGWEMEQVARAFKKAPGYFAEYRKAVVVAALAMKLEANPEATVKYWRELAVAEAG